MKSPGRISTWDLEPKLMAMLSNLLKPVQVEDMIFTKSIGRIVRGVILTSRPNGVREHPRNFEVRFAGVHSGEISSVSVGGRRLRLRNSVVSASKRRVKPG